jgi:hypothetical protein
MKRKIPTDESKEKKPKNLVEDIVGRLSTYSGEIGACRLRWAICFCVEEMKLPSLALSPFPEGDGLLPELATWFEQRNANYLRSVAVEYTDIESFKDWEVFPSLFHNFRR